MPAVFVHGVPDTKGVWRKTIALLERKDIVALSLPGFGVALPPGFLPTKEGYVEWLLGELGRIEGPIDLVGHDWGSMLVVRAVSLAPGIARSWAGGGAPVDTGYVWHDTARAWQTPGRGEEMMAQISPAMMEAGLAAQGQPADIAAESAAAFDDTMKASILSLYRSAVHVGREWQDDLACIAAPGLVLWGDGDPYAKPEFGERLAGRTRAQFTLVDQCGHWYQAQRPRETADALQSFWAAAANQGSLSR